MAFNQVNLKGRDYYRVRSRVLGFTNSTKVEFLEQNLRMSVPLYSVFSFPTGAGVAFCVEVDGYLTFDEGSQVKLVETTPFERTDFSATSFVQVYPADPYQPVLDHIEATLGTVDQNGNYTQANLCYYTKQFNQGDYMIARFNLPRPYSPNDVSTYLTSVGAVYASTYLGPTGYPGLTFVEEHKQ